MRGLKDVNNTKTQFSAKIFACSIGMRYFITKTHKTCAFHSLFKAYLVPHLLIITKIRNNQKTAKP